jgi:hypothetical protein
MIGHSSNQNFDRPTSTPVSNPCLSSFDPLQPRDVGLAVGAGEAVVDPHLGRHRRHRMGRAANSHCKAQRCSPARSLAAGDPVARLPGIPQRPPPPRPAPPRAHLMQPKRERPLTTKTSHRPTAVSRMNVGAGLKPISAILGLSNAYLHNWLTEQIPGRKGEVKKGCDSSWG